jgi:hypothetical protein
MIDIDPAIRDRLDRLVPEPAETGDWRALVGRARKQRVRRRVTIVLAVVALAAVAVSPVGGAIAGGIGDFSTWLSGDPGSPAAPDDQAAFERAWSEFPPGTELRSLIRTSVGGRQYELFGFRSGGSLCLQLVARGTGGPVLGCAPLAELRAAKEPALVVMADHPFGLAKTIPAGHEYAPPESAATFGIVADGVERLTLEGDEGPDDATIASNAFLHVTDHPTLGSRVRRVIATFEGRQVEIPFRAAPFGDLGTPPTPSSAKPSGPATVERHIEGGSIGWLERREPRGEAGTPTYLRQLGHTLANVEFARLLTPDPKSSMRILVAIGTLNVPFGPRTHALCVFLVSADGAGGGCYPAAHTFTREPLMWGESLADGGGQYTTLSGVASDDVARLDLFLATGERRQVPLADNAWAIQVPRAKYPVRLVAYDDADRVIAVVTRQADLTVNTGPRPVPGTWRAILRVETSTGAVGTLRIARSTNGEGCWKVLLPGGAGGSGCPPKNVATPPLSLAMSLGRDGAWLYGQVDPQITRVQVNRHDGTSVSLEPTDRFVLAHLGDTIENASASLREAVGYDATGNVVGEQTFSTR